LNLLYESLIRLPSDHSVRRLARRIYRIERLRPILSALVGLRSASANGVPLQSYAPPMILKPMACPQTSYPEVFRRIAAARSDGHVKRRVLLVNWSLAAGGAERQVVNTLRGLAKQELEGVSFLGEYLFHRPENTFLLPELDGSGITVAQPQKRIVLSKPDASVAPLIAEVRRILPGHLVEEIFDLAEEFRVRRPEIVHAWQDSTAIKSAIAGLIVGVPRIVMSSRNMNPSNFAYYQEYMRPAYQALAARSDIVLYNNSNAGAADYARWLGIPVERIHVVRNGVAFDRLSRDEEAGKLLRRRIGIPLDVTVVGGLFRFSPEKRPLLWLRTAAQLLQEQPDIYFLLAGEGPLFGEINGFLARLPEAARIRVVPPVREVEAFLTGVDMLLLTSRFEGTPNVVLEASWLGVPVVATEAGGAAEAVANDRTGVISRSDEPDAIAQLISSMLNDPDWIMRARRHGPRFVQRHFGLDRMVNETMALYGYAPPITSSAESSSSPQ
jgi:glycosyltransferase involved in cell wall biosynthesis